LNHGGESQGPLHKPYTSRHKGKLERGINYVQNNALKRRTFTSLAEENRHLQQWQAAVADTRIHGTTRRQVGKVFREADKPALQSRMNLNFLILKALQQR